MASPWIDVLVTLRTSMVHWPGDPPARFSCSLDVARGGPCAVSLPEMGRHAGTHMDVLAGSRSWVPQFDRVEGNGDGAHL